MRAKTWNKKTNVQGQQPELQSNWVRHSRIMDKSVQNGIAKFLCTLLLLFCGMIIFLFYHIVCRDCICKRTPVPPPAFAMTGFWRSLLQRLQGAAVRRQHWMRWTSILEFRRCRLRGQLIGIWFMGMLQKMYPAMQKACRQCTIWQAIWYGWCVVLQSERNPECLIRTQKQGRGRILFADEEPDLKERLDSRA